MEASITTAAASEQAFDALLQRHRGIVFKIANTYAHDAEDRADLAQDIAMQLWRAWPQYDPARPFSTWMYRIALNVGISFLRARGPRRHDVALDDATHDLIIDPRDGQEQQDALRVLRRFIDTLGALECALLVLYLEERSTREIAEILGLGESNVTTKISRLTQRIRGFAATPAT